MGLGLFHGAIPIAWREQRSLFDTTASKSFRGADNQFGIITRFCPALAKCFALVGFGEHRGDGEYLTPYTLNSKPSCSRTLKLAFGSEASISISHLPMRTG
jgi:hypothetical protein